MPKFPKQLYIKREVDGDTHYFVSFEDVDGAAEMGHTARIGVYKLVQILNVTGVAEARHVKDVK